MGRILLTAFLVAVVIAGAGIALTSSSSRADDDAPPPTPDTYSRGAADPVTPTPVPSPTPTPTPVPPTPTPIPPTPVPKVTRPAGEIVRGNTERPEMALTFDCGASGVQTPAILQALHDAGVRSTFFITGRWATIYPDLTRQIAAEHEVANHSWSHPDFATMNDGQIQTEMLRGEQALNQIAGVNTKPYWRAPFGSRDARILRVVREAGWGYEVLWSADSGDWTEISPAQVRANVNKAASNGAIIVEHCGSDQTAAVLPQIIADLKAKGFRLVTVSDILRD
jgi:peptidoglycan/xylan/chitin deacetylase (PgdA/CDA1 family)